VSPPHVAIVGSGGREHALAHVLARSADVIVTPGNPGMPATSAEGHRITVSAQDPLDLEVDLVVIGPEAPLVEGLADRLRANGRLVVGPGADGARLEGSKAYMKQALADAGIPTARFGAFDQLDAALAYARTLPGPWVVKTDGLAAGKGVLVARSLEEAEHDIADKLSGVAFGDAGRTVVIEEGLEGVECSLLALCDGNRAVPLSPAQDFKRVDNHDAGPNTGGMGAYSPLPFVDDALVSRLMDETIEPLLAELRVRGIDYRGILYAGVMLTDDGPRILEYNVRLGDPETQAVLPLLASDLTGLFMEVARGELTTTPVFTDDAAVTVVLASQGYPGPVHTGDEIRGLDDHGQLAEPVDGVVVFHGGTARNGVGPFVTAGGRVLGVTGIGPNLDAARERAYRASAKIHWSGMHHRDDIAAGMTSPAEGVRS
jgi:phosphoribosylamine---glycine ligase